MALANVGIENVKLFRELKAVEEVVGDTSIEVWPKILFAAEADRFELWAINMGLFVSGHGSLDYRVREAENLGHTLLRFMSDLKDSLTDVLLYCAGERDSLVPPDDAAPSFLDLAALDEDSGDELSQGYSLLLDSLSDPITRLYKLATSIRNPSCRFESSKARRHKDIDPESKVDFLQAVERFDLDYVRSLFLQYRKEKVMENSPSRAPLDDEHSGNDEDNDDQVWEPVRTLLSQYETERKTNTESFLIHRIVRSNVRRRTQFAYWKNHRNKLARLTRPFTEPTPLPREAIPAAVNIETQAGGKVAAPLVPEQSITTATRLNIGQMRSRDDRSVVSVSEYAPSTQVSMDIVDFPPAPKRQPSEKFFECQYCFTLCSTALLAKNAWKAHLIHDLRPYICTYEECRSSDQLYDTRQDWLQHEASHRMVWRCPEHPDPPFPSLDDYREHLSDGHIDSSGAVSARLLHAAESTIVVADRPCPICLFYPETGKELQSHVALHLERFSLFSLPRAANNADDEDGDEGGSQNVNTAVGTSRDGDSDKSSDVQGESDLLMSAAAIARQRWSTVLNRTFKELGLDMESLRLTVIRSPLRNMHDNGTAFLAEGKMEEAEEMFTQILDTRRRAFGDENQRTLASMSDLAAVYEMQGRWTEAEQIRGQVMDTRTRLLGQDHPDTLISMANLAVPYRNQGRVTEAQDLERRLQDAEELHRTLMTGESMLGQEAMREEVQKDDQARLFDAVRTGNEALVKQLLATEGVHPDATDSNDRTPLSWAAGFGDTALVALFLATDGVNPDFKDCRGQTPLSWAADCGHEAIVELLLANNQVDPDVKDASGWTPLAWAASKGYGPVVRSLLAKEGVDADSKSLSGLTPLTWAIVNGYEGVVKLLLESGRVDATYEDSSGITPLLYAEMNGHDGIVEMLESHLESLETGSAL